MIFQGVRTPPPTLNPPMLKVTGPVRCIYHQSMRFISLLVYFTAYRCYAQGQLRITCTITALETFEWVSHIHTFWAPTRKYLSTVWDQVHQKPACSATEQSVISNVASLAITFFQWTNNKGADQHACVVRMHNVWTLGACESNQITEFYMTVMLILKHLPNLFERNHLRQNKSWLAAHY